ncbi:hypothetical protein [Proteiniphilum acetatigenes]|uniref:hypothetical protein n=1 Tax=Proteiniphilum acetatigenes TaxID=294710 RepID=UPI001FE0F66F|nr:hypothetical protein [Proteiniphilum acetatigenes]
MNIIDERQISRSGRYTGFTSPVFEGKYGKTPICMVVKLSELHNANDIYDRSTHLTGHTVWLNNQSVFKQKEHAVKVNSKKSTESNWEKAKNKSGIFLGYFNPGFRWSKQDHVPVDRQDSRITIQLSVFLRNVFKKQDETYNPGDPDNEHS